jgi:hypothetical protein
MNTDALIERLSQNAEPVRAGAVLRRLSLGVALGGAVSFVLMVAWLGIRPDLMTAMGTAAYWMKFLYTLLFAVSGLWTLERLSRPGASARSRMILEALPFAALAAWAAMRLMMAPADVRMPMLMGSSHQVCPWRIAILALPVFTGVFWSLRGLAPTRPWIAGAAAGLLAGAAGAFVYAFHCDENAAAFVALWYTLGIAAVGALGAFVGRLLLRW